MLLNYLVWVVQKFRMADWWISYQIVLLDNWLLKNVNTTNLSLKYECCAWYDEQLDENLNFICLMCDINAAIF